MVSGPVLLKIKGKSWIFMFWGVKQLKKTKTKMKTVDEIGQILVSGALDDTKTIGKVGADIFLKSGPEKTKTNWKESNLSPGFSSFFPWA